MYVYRCLFGDRSCPAILYDHFLHKRFEFETDVLVTQPPFLDHDIEQIYSLTLGLRRSPVFSVQICTNLIEPVNEVPPEELDDVFLTQGHSLTAEPTLLPTPTVQIDQEDHRFTAGTAARLEWDLCSSCVANVYENGNLLLNWTTQSYQIRDINDGLTEYKVEKCFSWSGGISCA